MKIADVLLLDFDREIEMARTYLEAVPEDKAAWKPHEKSSTLGEIAKHIAVLPNFGVLFLETDVMHVSGDRPPKFEFVSKADLFSTLDESSAKLHTALARSSDEFLMQEWAFRKEGKVLDAASRASMVNTMCIHHLIHHRAQLGVYLRLLNVSLPGLYGPSADQPWKPGRFTTE